MDDRRQTTELIINYLKVCCLWSLNQILNLKLCGPWSVVLLQSVVHRLSSVVDRPSLRLFDHLHFRIQPDIITHYYLAGFCNGIPGESEFFTADFSCNGKTCLCLSVRI